MKKLSITGLGLILLIFALIGCTVSTEQADLWNDPTVQEVLSEAAPNEGVLAVKLPSSKALDTNWAESNSDTYAVYAYNNDTIVSGYAFSDSASVIAIAIPAGNYNIFALAGKKVQSDNPSNGIMLLGSGKVDGEVNIMEGQVTTVNITFNPVSLSISSPDPVDTGSTFEVVVTGSYGINILRDNGFTLRTTFDDPEATSNNFSESIYPLTDPNKSFSSGANFKRTFEVTAPINTDNGTSWTLWFCTNQITLEDEDGSYHNRTLNDNGLEWSFVWSHTNPAYRITNFPGLTTYKTITLQQTDNLNVSLSW